MSLAPSGNLLFFVALLTNKNSRTIYLSTDSRYFDGDFRMHTELNEENEGQQAGIARLQILQSELKKEFKKYPSLTIAFKRTAKNTQVSQRTLKRIVNGTHTPNFQTLLKVYRYLTGSLNDRDTFLKMPKILQESVAREYTNFSLQNKNAQFLPEVDLYLQDDSVFRGIYIETAAGLIHRDKVGFEYGQHGLRVLDKMLELDIIKEIEPDVFASSSRRAQLDPESITKIARFLLENKFNPDKLDLNGENFAQILIEGVDKETYNKLLALDHGLIQKRVEIIKNGNRGEIKYWMINFIDTLSKDLIYEDNKQSDRENKVSQ